MKNNKRRIVITGVGPLTAIGSGKEDLWKALLRGKTGLKEQSFSIDDEAWDSFRLHKIDGFNISDFGIDQTALDDLANWKKGRINRELLYFIASIKLALDDSKLDYDKQKNDIGLFLTVEHPAFEPFCEDFFNKAFELFSKSLAQNRKLTKKEAFRYIYENTGQEAYDLQTFMYLFLVSKIFAFHGYSLFNNNACASGLFAIESAARQIKYGKSDIAIVSGADYPCTMFKHLWFKERGIYAADGRIKPFAADADGLVFGDGAAAIILEEFEHAKKRKAAIYAEYLGGGFSLEGWKVTLPQIGSDYYHSAIRACLENSSLKPKDIDLINPHGVGIKITDLYESTAIRDIFGPRQMITAFKPYVGHNLGGSAILETIILLLAMRNKTVPPTLNCAHADKRHEMDIVREFRTHDLRTTMKLSCGFAGYNGAAIFKRTE